MCGGKYDRSAQASKRSLEKARDALIALTVVFGCGAVAALWFAWQWREEKIHRKSAELDVADVDAILASDQITQNAKTAFNDARRAAKEGRAQAH